MKTSLDHLPEVKREQLARITEIYCRGAPVEMFILFGSYARGNWVEDFRTGYFSDYDLLAIVRDRAAVADHARWSPLDEQARALTGHVLVHTIVHDVESVNEAIRTGQYFFLDIVREGVWLYDSKAVTLVEFQPLGREQLLINALNDFRHWFDSARGFWFGAADFFRGGHLSHAAFMLHQAAEMFFHTVLLVFDGYKTKTHQLKWLALKAARVHPAMVDALPFTSPEDEQLFRLLNRAYIEAQHYPDFRITVEQLGELLARVIALAVRVRVACVERLKELGGEQAIADLPPIPTIREMYQRRPPVQPAAPTK